MVKLSVTVSDFRTLHRNTLVGFCTVHITELRLSIFDVAIHVKNASRWAAFPSKPWVRDNGLVFDENGRPKYVPVFQFDDRKTADAFSRDAIAELIEYNPHAFATEESAA